MPAVIFSGSKVKTLKKILSFFGGVEIQSSTVDPTSSAVDAPKGSLLLNESNGLVYKKLDAGSSTNWNLLGSNGINLNLMEMDSSFQPTKITNANAEISIGDWVSYADAASTAPVDMTGGSPNSTITRTTSALNGSGSFLMTINSGASRQGEGISCLVNIPQGYRGQSLSFVFPFNTTGSLVEDDFKIYAYDVTNSTLITPTNFSKILGANGQVSAQFPVATNTAQLRVGIHIARTSTGAATITFDDVSLSNVIVPFGLSGSNPISYTPTFTGFGTVLTQSFRYSWVGNRIIIEGTFTSGTPTATIAEISLPTNLLIDSTLGNNVPVGIYAVNIAASGQFNVLATSSGSSLKIGYTATVGAGGNTPVNGSAISSNGALISFYAIVPINGKSANLSIGESSTFNISSYLANGTRVTSTPTKLGEYRTYKKTASAYAGTDEAPSTAPSALNGMRIYAVPYASAGTSGETNRWEIFIGKNKTVKAQFYQLTGKTGYIDVQPLSFGEAVVYGAIQTYDPTTGIIVIDTIIQASGTTTRYLGRDIDGDVLANGYFDLIVSENALAVSSQQPRSEVWLYTGNGYGSTNTKIRRFTNTAKNIGTAITYADSSTAGASFTINEDGVYSILFTDGATGSGGAAGISLNSSELTTNIYSITATNRLAMSNWVASSSGGITVNSILNLSAGDIIRPHTDGVGTGNFTTSAAFRITKVSN